MAPAGRRRRTGAPTDRGCRSWRDMVQVHASLGEMMQSAGSHPTAAARRVDAGTWLALAALTALGAALRLTGLAQQSLWNDELSSLTVYTQPLLQQVITAT